MSDALEAAGRPREWVSAPAAADRAHHADARPSLRERFDTEPLSAPVAPLVGVRMQRLSIIAVAAAAAAAAAWIASALWAGLLLGVLVAFAIEPGHRRLLRFMPRRRGLASGISVGAVALSGVGLVALLFELVVEEVIVGAESLRDALQTVTASSLLTPSAERTLATFGVTPAMVAERVIRFSDRAAELASTVVSAVVGSAFSWLGGSLIALVTAFYTLKDRRPIERRLEQILPLHPGTTRELVHEFRKIGRGTLLGSVVAGLVQGAFGAAGYAIAGVPRPVLLGVLTAAASFIPVFGTLLVWVPLGVGLVATGRAGAGVFELAWGVVITTSLVDYVLRPFLVGRESRSHPLLFLIGLIGGVEVLGGVGIVAGPIVMAFFASALRIYRREVVDPLRQEAR